MSCYECLKKDYCPYIHRFNHDKNVGCIEFQDKDYITYISNTLNIEKNQMNKELDLGTVFKFSKLYINDENTSIVFNEKEYTMKQIETELKRLGTLETRIEVEQNNERYWKQECIKLDEILRIINKKNVDIGGIKRTINVAISNKAALINAKTKEFIKPYIYYNMSRPKNERLTEEEFETIKEN